MRPPRARPRLHPETSRSRSRPRAAGGGSPLRRLILVAAALLAPALARGAIPTYVGTGSGTIVGSTGTCTPQTTGVTWQDNDLLIVVSQSENQAISLDTANGFVEVGTQASQAGGTGGSSPATRLAVWYKIANGGGADSMPVLADSGDHTSCQLLVFRGIDTSSPFDVTASGNDGGTNDTDANVPGGTTTGADRLVVAITAPSNNANNTSNCSGETNASLANLTEIYDSTSTSGLGGGICAWTGEKASAGTVSATTATISVSTYEGSLMLALKPPSAVDVTRTITATGGNGAAGTVSVSLSTPVTVTVTATGGNGAAGTVSASGAASSTLATTGGNGEAGAVSTDTGGGAANATVTATGGSGAAGAVSASGSADSTVALLGGNGGVGVVSASGAASSAITVGGADGAAGAVSASGWATATLSSLGGDGAAGVATADVSGGVDVTVTGVGGLGGAGVLSIPASLQDQIDALKARVDTLERKIRRLIPIIP